MAGLQGKIVISCSVMNDVTMSEESPSSRDFAGLYRATVTPLRRYLRRMLGNVEDAQDIAHDAYLRVRPEIEARRADKPEALLYTTARRLALNQLKRRRIAPVSPNNVLTEIAASPAPGVVQQVVARQELQRLENAIAQLPEGCRTVLLLRKIDLLSHQEIGERLGIAVSTVEKQHARALRLLRAALTAPEATPVPGASKEKQP